MTERPVGWLAELAERYRKELLESVIPFWMRHCLDRDFGGYFSCLDRDGSVYDTTKYVWPQGRHVWMFSRLYNEVERRQEWLEAARLGVDFVRRFAFDPKGRCYFSLTREGAPVFYQRKPFAAVFVMMGLLEYSKATGDVECRRQAVELFWAIDRWIQEPALMDRPVFPGRPAVSNLANWMVLASMAMELVAVDNDTRYYDMMRLCVTGIGRHFEPRRRLLVENVALDGEISLAGYPEGRLFNPGHSVEVAWFLLELSQLLSDETARQMALEAIEGTLETGWDQSHGGLYYFMDLEGRPTLQLEATMKLWWPHTEALYALVLAYSLTGEARWLNWLDRVDRYAFSHFPDPQFGEWFGYCDRQGNRTHDCKGNNYKGCFHVPRALLMSWQCLSQLNRRRSVVVEPKG